MVATLNEQIVGQPLMLECEMLTARGISSRVDVVWSRDGVEVEHINDISSNFSSPEVVVYTNIYTIPLLGTYHDDIVYECEVIINSSPIHNITDSVTLDVTGMCTLIIEVNVMVIYPFTVPLPAITIVPTDTIQGAMVGSPQTIICTVNTVDGVESSSVTINWIGPEGSFTNSSRITTKSDTEELESLSYHNKYNSTLQFAYLMEGDEGVYTCSVTILDTANFHEANIRFLTGK